MLRAAAIALMLAAAIPGHAASVDLRDCPLDTVLFLDPWAGGSFAVKRVGTDYFWNCPEGASMPDPSCEGPYGDLVLEGSYRENRYSAERPMTAVWSVIKAVPCCGWSLTDGSYRFTQRPDFKWLSDGDVPTLGTMNWLTIDVDSFKTIGNPLHAVACTLR